MTLIASQLKTRGFFSTKIRQQIEDRDWTVPGITVYHHLVLKVYHLY